MNDEDKEGYQNLIFLLTLVYQTALPVWERYHGNVPSPELPKLDEEGDWPRGLASAVMKRLSRDQALRKQLRKHFGWSTPPWDHL